MNIRVATSLVCITFASTAWAQEDAPQDIEGAKDHPAVKRYPGSVITESENREFESFAFPIGDSADGVKTKTTEGRYLHLTYLLPEKASCTQVIRNYENAFKAAGLTLHTGKNAPTDSGWGDGKWVSGEGKVKGQGGPMFITYGCETSTGAPIGHLWVVEAQQMEQKVEIDAAAMADEIAKNGRIALYGINFATGKADITPDSAKVLEQIGQLLKLKPDWKLRVEGHTDNVGQSKANLTLSKKRAEAVKEYLVKKLGVDAARLSPEGYGDTKPLAPNTDDEGRAKNRRVELSKL